MSALNEIGDQDRWICWLCDQPVDPDASVNSDLGPSVDTYAPIFESAERLARKGGRETVARFSDEADANRAADWLIDRLGRLSPEVEYTAKVMPGGGQFTLALFAGR